MALCFTGDEKSLLVGDKTGEVYKYRLDDWTQPGENLLGHFSMLLDMVLSPSNSHVITCDRDEKIRVSKFPNSYNIECFCLAHTEFVSSICLCPQWPHLLISGSGDGTVRSWQWAQGRLLGSKEIGVRDEGAGHVAAVTKVCCSSRHEPPLVIATVESSPQIHAFTVSAEGAFTEWGTFDLPSTPWDAVFDWSDNLWVCLNSQPRPVMCFKPSEGKFSEVSCSENAVLDSLCKCQHLQPGLGVGGGGRRDWDQLRKHVVDNMSTYLARKEERLVQAKKPHPLSTTSSDGTTTPENDSTHTPPIKKSKTDDFL